MNKYEILIILLFTFIISVGSYRLVAADNTTNDSGNNAACNQDIYTCTDWGACTPQGTQTRTCTLVSTCPNADNEKPLETQFCEYVTPTSSKLKCTEMDTTRQRVLCRLGLSSKDLSAGLNLAYEPEDCRAIYDSVKRDECIKQYSDMQQCWEYDTGSSRTRCIKDRLNVLDVSKSVSVCKTDVTCIALVRKNVYALIKFQIDELENRAKEMNNQDLITKSQAADVMSFLEQQKLAIDNAKSKQDRIKAVESAKQQWIEFINQVKEAQK